MTVQRIGSMNNRFIGLSTDTKPDTTIIGATFFEYDTQALYITPDGGTTWTLKENPANPVAVTSIDLHQAADDYDLFQAMAQALFIDFLCIIIPRDLSGEAALTAISIQSTDVAPVEFLSAVDGAIENLDTAGLHVIYVGPDIVAATKKIQLTIAGGATAAECICPVYVSYRPAVAGGYLAVS
jgi:hypothetical protein